MVVASPQNCKPHVTQGSVIIQEMEYLAVVVPHEAENFSLQVDKRMLDYDVFDGSVMTTTGMLIFKLDPEHCYLIMGTYKSLEETQKHYRDALIYRGFNIDENILIIKQIG